MAHLIQAWKCCYKPQQCSKQTNKQKEPYSLVFSKWKLHSFLKVKSYILVILAVKVRLRQQ